MTRLTAQNKELRIRPPVEEFAASYFGYRPTHIDDAVDEPHAEVRESELPEFEP
jgi:hypothetical protein